MDDTDLIVLFQDGAVHQGPAVDDFVERCENHFQKLNVKKTKKMTQISENFPFNHPKYN